MDFGKYLSILAATNSEKTAFYYKDEWISYEQLEHSSASLARWFIQQGCKPGDRVTLHWPNSIDMVTLLFACFKAGLIAVPVNVRLKAPEVAYLLGHSKPSISFAHSELFGATEEAYRDVTSCRRVQFSLPYLASSNAQLPTVNDDDPALILYTSGTTARPKGVMHTHRTLLESAKLVTDAESASMQTVLVMTQMAFISAISCILSGVLAGGTCVLVRAFDAPQVLDAIERFQCTFTFGLPSMAQMLIEEQQRNPRQVRSLRTFLAGGDAVPEILQQQFQLFFGIVLRELFGMTEIGPAIWNPPDDIRSGSLGKPPNTVEVRVVDSKGKEVRDGQIGEIVVRGPANFVGYWDDPAATRDAVRGGWMYTGDLGRRDEDGYVWFEGRKKEIIVRDGINIAPQDVEAVLVRHPAVLEAAVIGVPDPIPARGERVIAFVCLRDRVDATGAELREHAAQSLADFKVPEKVILVKSLPKGVTGKIQRRALRENLVHYGVFDSPLPLGVGTNSDDLLRV